MRSIRNPYLLFLGDAPDPLAAKVAQGIVDWRPEFCVGQLRLPNCNADLGLDDMTLERGKTAGAKTLVVGVANRGGVISESWIEILSEALVQGYDLAAGLHSKLADIEQLSGLSAQYGRTLFDVRHPTDRFDVGSGRKRSGQRLLAVGTDCSCGKMYTTLAMEKEMKSRGMKASFRATGQTGILITGNGVSIDAVIADFIAGAVEFLSPENDVDHWDIIEGQGSLFHPSFAGVSMGLLHGAQADALIMCHEPTRTHMRGLPDYALPSIDDCMEANLRAASLTNKNVRFAGLSINTSKMNAGDADGYLKDLSREFDMPAVDPFRAGVGPIVDNL